MIRRAALITLVLTMTAGLVGSARADQGFSAEAKENLQWLKIKAANKVERSAVADIGVSIERISDDHVVALGSPEQRDRLERAGLLLTSFGIDQRTWDFPTADAGFHNYDRMMQELKALALANPDIAALDSIGQSVEKRDIWRLRISKDPASGDSKPAIAIMGGHHAREHLSMELPLLMAKRLIDGYRAGEPEIVKLVEGRDIHLIPMVNPDGAEFDIATGRYQIWRKNRARAGRDYGVDLNRNYGYGWGTGGSSSNPSDETYKGPAAFSEPETQAIKAFIEKQTNISVLLTLHTFSELVLYPWGGVYDPIADSRDRAVFETMGRKMASWNGYHPQQSSELYIASGDTTDWAYGAHKIFAFTFELDPSSIWSGGFYPGQAVIQPVFQKNLKPMLYMMDLADNPYRATQTVGAAYGVGAVPLK